MRIFGGILIVFGLLLCLTIIGIPAGIFFIFIGTILVVLGGRRRTVINNVVQVSTLPGQQSVSMEASSGRFISPPTHTPVIDARPSLEALPRASVDDYDRAKWNALVNYDDDIAKVAERLSVLGQRWIDEFAKAYLAINDKTYLPIILDKIIAQARDKG